METGPPPPPAPPPNTRFGRYTLIDRLAVGGMAEVFRAQEPRPVGEPRLVVVKRMLPSVAARPGALQMFRAEADLGAVVHHRNVVEVLGFGQEAGQPYLALEYVRGVDLWQLGRTLTRRGATLGVQLSLFVVRNVLSGLAAVHDARDADGRPLSVVHRDVSPSNVLLSVHGEVKLADFGIAVSRHHDQLRGPLTDRAKGKLGYLAPEQVTGAAVDSRADVFGAGVICAELLMGRPLFSGGSELAVLLAIRDAKIHPFNEIAGQLPDGLARVVAEALAKSPDERIASAAELAERLAPFATEDDEALATELAERVREASSEIGEGPDAPTPFAEESDADQRTPVVDAPTTRYEITTSDGEQLGPWSYAKVVEAVAVGRLGPFDRVTDGSGPAAAIQDVAALRRHLPPSTTTAITRETEAPDEPDELVPLSHGGIVSALSWSALRHDTGLWLCEAGDVRKEVYVARGAPEFVTSNLAGELLGEYLVSKQVIDRGELDMALAVMPRFEGRLGDTLAALGLVEPVHLFQHIAAQVRDKLLDLFRWETGNASFYRGVPPPQSGFPMGIDPWQLLDDGIRRRIADGLEAERFQGRVEHPLRMRTDVPSEVRHGVLPADAKALLNALSSPRTLAELRGVLRVRESRDSHRVHRSVVLLMHLGAVEWC